MTGRGSWRTYPARNTKSYSDMRTSDTDVCARITLTAFGETKIEAQRAKYKHWYELGRHKATDTAFEQSLKKGCIKWNGKLTKEGQLL